VDALHPVLVQESFDCLNIAGTINTWGRSQNFFGAILLTIFCKLDHCNSVIITFLCFEKV
jgi:hypothetical protein